MREVFLGFRGRGEFFQEKGERSSSRKRERGVLQEEGEFFRRKGRSSGVMGFLLRVRGVPGREFF